MEPVLELVRCSGDMEVTEGEDAWFDCQLQWTRPVSESVSVTVSWYKDDDLIPADDEDFKQTFDGVIARLFISGTYLDDAGVYTCTSRTSDGRHEASVTARLVVNGLFTTYTHTEQYQCKVKSKEGYSSLQASLPSPLRQLTCHMGSHSVSCHPAEVTFPPLPQPKLVLDLATPQECKAELT